MPSFSIRHARQQFDVLLAHFRSEPEQSIVLTTDEGEPVAVVLSWTQYESLMETLDIYSDATLMEDMRRSIREMEEGRTLSSEEAWRKLGW